MTRPVTEIAEIDGHRIEYRREGGADRTVVVLHGGHMSAACRFGEETYLLAGWSVLVVSRPGYGRTDLGVGPSVPEFAVRVAALCRRLQIDRAAAVGISLGARSAMTLAAFAPDLVDRVILMCPVSFRPWPPARERRLAHVVFAPGAERATWGAVHGLLQRDPERHLPSLIGNLTTLSGAEAVARLGPDRRAAVDFLISCRSGSGFIQDLKPPTDVTDRIRQPALILATRTDGSVSWAHPAHLAATLPNAELAGVPTPTHLLWLGEGADVTARRITTFLNGH